MLSHTQIFFDNLRCVILQLPCPWALSILHQWLVTIDWGMSILLIYCEMYQELTYTSTVKYTGYIKSLIHSWLIVIMLSSLDIREVVKKKILH